MLSIHGNSSAARVGTLLGLSMLSAVAAMASADIVDIGILNIKGSDPFIGHMPVELQSLGFTLVSTRLEFHLAIDTDQAPGEQYGTFDATGLLFNTDNDRNTGGHPTDGSMLVSLDSGGMDVLSISMGHSSSYGFMMDGWTLDYEGIHLKAPRGALGDGSLASVLTALRQNSFTSMWTYFGVSGGPGGDDEFLFANWAGTADDYTITIVPAPGTWPLAPLAAGVFAIRRRRTP